MQVTQSQNVANPGAANANTSVRSESRSGSRRDHLPLSEWKVACFIVATRGQAARSPPGKIR